MSISVMQLAQLIGARVDNAPAGQGPCLESISLDSSSVARGGMFAALPGTRVHGAAYAGQAAACAAAAILSDAAGAEILRHAGELRPVLVVKDVRAVLGHVAAEIYGHPTREMTVIGITGTSGKTTTSYLLEAGLVAAGKTVGLIGTTGTRINREPVPTKLTTPEAPKLQELFATMRDRGVTHVVMEVSSHALALGRVQGTRFAVGGFSNLSQDHLDFHPTMEDYFEAKALLFDGHLDQGRAAHAAVVCIDDPWGQRMAERAKAAGLPVTTVSSKPSVSKELDHAAEITALQVAVEPTGAQSVAVTENGHSFEFHLPLPGDFNVANAALALGLAEAVGIGSSGESGETTATVLNGAEEKRAFIRGIEGVAVPGRMERIDRGQDFVAVVDYAHKPAAVAAVLDTLRQQLGDDVQRHRIGVVIGAGGDRDCGKRPIMGANAAQRAQLVIVTDDNPRSEEPAAIRQAVLAGAWETAETNGVQVREVASRAEAIDALVAWARPGDAIAVVGKGHEVGQIYGEETIHFDDREELARALNARRRAGDVTPESGKN